MKLDNLKDWPTEWDKLDKLAEDASRVMWRPYVVSELIKYDNGGPAREFVSAMSPLACRHLIAQLRILMKFYSATKDVAGRLGLKMEEVDDEFGSEWILGFHGSGRDTTQSNDKRDGPGGGP